MPEPVKVAETELGYFDPVARQYVITTHGTPAPWINYVGLEGQLCGIVSNHAGGPTWFRDPLARRVTRYVQVGCNKDRPGRWLYVRDNETGDYWSPGHQPVARPLPERYECRHGTGYTRISSRHHGIGAEMLHFIPLGERVEVQRVVLSNESERERSLSLFSYREFVNNDAASDLTNIQFSGHLAQVEFDEDDPRVLYVLTNYRHGAPLPFFAVSEEPAGFDTKCEVFLGDGNAASPQVVREGRCTGSLAGDDTAVGVFQLDLTLAPGQQKVLHFVLGLADERDGAREAVGRWLGDDVRVLDALEDLKRYAVALLENLQCTAPDDEMNVMVNTWNAYQCWVNFQFSRSISGHAVGLRRGMGTRDSLQDLLGYMHMSPDGARRRLIEIMRAVQLQDGGCQHQYSALTQQGSGQTGFSDDHLWGVLATSAYVKETGDAAILDDEFSYSDNRELAEDLYCHLVRAIDYSVQDRGAHGIPRLRAADWNDCIGDGPDETTSESVLVGIMLVKMCRDMVRLTELGGRTGRTVEYDGREMPIIEYLETVAGEVTEAVNEHAWQEEGWYARGTDRHGEWFGVASREEGKIFLEPQPWAVMAGVADQERGRTAMDSVRQHLATPYGIHILQPGCTKAPSGNFEVFPKGAKENAGIFCHPNPWAVCAETILGRGQRAFEYYRATLPAAAHQEDPFHYTAEPYVYGQLRYGSEHREFGKCAGTWLTGTAAWNYVAATQYILGVRPEWGGLCIDPCIPPDWPGLEVTRRFRGETYVIVITNPDRVSKGVASMTCDGVEVEGNVLPVAGEGRTHKVEVVMG